MFAPPCEDVHIVRSAREFRFGRDAWTRILRQVDADHATCLSDKPHGTVWLVQADLPEGPTPLVLKVHAPLSRKDRVRSSLHMGRLRRQWRGAARLSRRGFRVAKCCALLHGTRDGQPLDVLVMHATPGRTLLDVLADGDLTPAQEHRLAEAVGDLANRLWTARLHSKDLKPSNLVVEPACGEDEPTAPPVLTIIDTDAVAHMPAHPLLPLVLEPSGLGVLPRRGVLWRALKPWAWHAWLDGPDRFAPADDPDGPQRSMETRIARGAWRELERLVREHGDATPRHNPIRAHEPVAHPAPLG